MLQLRHLHGSLSDPHPAPLTERGTLKWGQAVSTALQEDKGLVTARDAPAAVGGAWACEVEADLSLEIFEM